MVDAPTLKCQNCGAMNSAKLFYCSQCRMNLHMSHGVVQESGEANAAAFNPPTFEASKTGDPGMMVFWGMVGLALGAFVGYLFRPSLPLVGQLPFSAVMTRGASLGEMDRLFLGSTAQESFNYLLCGALLGGVIGAVIGHAQKVGAPTVDIPTAADAPQQAAVSEPSRLGQIRASSPGPLTISLGQTRESVAATLGGPQKIMDLGPKTLYIYADVKVTFEDGRVVDVQ